MSRVRRIGLVLLSVLFLNATFSQSVFAQEECGDFFTTRWNQTATDANLCELDEEVLLFGEPMTQEDLSHPVITVIIPTPPPPPPPPAATPVPSPTPTPEEPSNDCEQEVEKKVVALDAEADESCSESEECQENAAVVKYDVAVGKVKGPKCLD